MLEKIKKALYAEYNPEEKKGLFLSGFGKNKDLIISQGILTCDTPLTQLTEDLYTAHIKPQAKKIRYVVCDIVLDIVEFTDTPKQFLTLSPEEYGFVAIDKEDDISGVLLPHTSGVADAKSALYNLKQKYGIHGQIELYAFRTKRIVIAK